MAGRRRPGLLLGRGQLASGRRVRAAVGTVFIGVGAALAFLVLSPSGRSAAARAVLQGLRWGGAHWLSAAAVTAIATVFAAAVALAGLIAERRLDRLSDPAADKAARERRVMLRRVRYEWITGVLEPSLAGTADLAVRLRRRPGSRAGDPVGRPARPSALVPEGVSIAQVFDEVGGALLITGAAGMGKTTLLLQLADELLDRAGSDPGQPIPVVLHLATWAAGRHPLETWLAEELSTSYNVPARTASAWVSQDALALLLDGFDEIASEYRAGCARAISAYRHGHGLVPVVVCSRTGEAGDLAAALRLDEAVELMPPDGEQVDRYLAQVEAAGTPLPDVRAVLAADPSLRDLVSSPLMLHVLASAYGGQPSAGLRQPGSSEQRRRRLWDAYIARMFEQRPLGPDCGYAPEQAVIWLQWLAAALREQDQAEFYLDRLTVSWLPRKRGRRGPVERLLWSLASARAEPVEELHWSWSTLSEGLRHLNRFQVLLLVMSLVQSWGLAAGLSALAAPRHGTAAPLTAGIMTWLWLTAITAAGFKPELRDKRTYPNEGTRRSARNGLRIGLAVTVATCLGGGTGFWLTARSPAAVIYALNWAVALGLGAAMTFGGTACVRHYAARALLARAGAAPWRYASFLQAMTDRLLLRRSGNGYLFAHHLLRDHLTSPPAGERESACPRT
jgi:hypothetical protein